jgi:ABC-type branched-subunit amino acid transport system substrate-binding protein
VPASSCLSEETVAELVEGRLEGERFDSAERHLSECERCMRLVSAASASGSTSGSPTMDAPERGIPGPPLARGTMVGRYEILEPVGSGGMGRVYAARDPVLDRRVALKLLHAYAATEELETRLLREAKAMARLSHPEVITVHDAGRFRDQLFIAMEFVEGRTLRQWLAAERRPWREVLDVFLRAGRGLARAHEAGIVHRDFKPDNVLVGDDGRVRVTDFGLARAVLAADAPRPAAPASPVPTPMPTPLPPSRRTADVSPMAETLEPTLTRTGAMLGTPAYMAPEQHVGAPADERSDVYAFCLSLYEGLYGERPFGGSNIVLLFSDKQQGRVRTPKDDRGVPLRLRRALLVGLRPDPGARYASMSELLAALERAARPPRAWLAVGAAIVALGAAGGIALAARGGRGGAATVPASASGSAPAVAAGPRECASNAACVERHGGEPWGCRAADGVCVPMATEDCTPAFEPGDLAAADTVWLGAMFPVKGPAYGRMNMDGAEMARAELARETSALSGSNASVHVRRIALVGCDDKVDARRAAAHLVDDVGVPAILGFGSGKELVDLAGSLLVQRRVLSVATLTESPAITRLPQPPGLPRMVWRTSYSVEAAANATAAFVRDAIEPRRRGGTTRVTLVREGGSNHLPFAQTFYRSLVLNGKPAAENGDDYREAVLDDAAAKDAYRALAARVAQNAPTIVVFVTSSDQTQPIVESLEAQWPAAEPRPTYVLSEDSTVTLASFIGKDPQRRRRVFATGGASAPGTAHFVLRFNLAHPGEATETLNPASSYDAFYLLAYASFALGDKPVTGPAIASAIPRLLPPGRPVETGPTDLFSALAALEKGENVDLSGPSGSLDFDPETAEWSPDFALFCPGLGHDGRVTDDVSAGATYVARTRRVEGTVQCP